MAVTRWTAHMAGRSCPLQRLPDEVLVGIFTLAVHGASTSDLDEHCASTSAYTLEDVASKRAQRSQYTVFTLSWVSRKWRSLVLATSRLWSAVPVAIRDVHVPRAKIDMYRHMLTLDRSSSTGSDVLIDTRVRGWNQAANGSILYVYFHSLTYIS
jgi:hypothetical protein